MKLRLAETGFYQNYKEEGMSMDDNKEYEQDYVEQEDTEQGDKIDLRQIGRIAFWVEVILAAACFINSVISLFVYFNELYPAKSIISEVILIFIYLITGVYLLYGYRIPHGNLFKFVLLVMAFDLAISVTIDPSPVMLVNAFFILAAVIISYVSGRLHKIEKNRMLIIVILVLLLLGAIGNFCTNEYGSYNYIYSQSQYDNASRDVFSEDVDYYNYYYEPEHNQNSFSCFLSSISWAVLFCAMAMIYDYRYDSHITAGINADIDKIKDVAGNIKLKAKKNTSSSEKDSQDNESEAAVVTNESEADESSTEKSGEDSSKEDSAKEDSSKEDMSKEDASKEENDKEKDNK